MNAFRGVALILVGTVWAFFWLCIFTSIDLPTDVVEMKIIQATLLLVMLFGIVPFGFGINRLLN
jgi:hypothetical protein